mgnify:CR=1 FL=1
MDKVLLIGVNTGAEENFEHSMEELALLAEACEMEVVGSMTQNLPYINKALYVGTGKIEEIKEKLNNIKYHYILLI